MLRLRYLSLGLLALAALSAAAGAQDSIESKYLSNIRQVTPTGYFVKAGEGYFSPDGKQVIYQATPKDYPFYQIFTQPLNADPNAESSRPKRVSTGRGRTTCAYFAKDGQRILFASSHLDPKIDDTEAAERKQQEDDKKNNVRRRYKWDFDPHTDIFEADLNGKILRQLTTEKGYDAEGAWTPDNKQIVFCSDRDGDPDLYVMDADGKNVRQLTNVDGYDGGPFTSPCGKFVLFRSDRKEKELLQIHVIGIDGKNDTALTSTNGVNWAPYWHPTEPYIIWTGADHSNLKSGQRPNYDLWLMKYEVKDGAFIPGKVTRITDHASADVLPVFSPDGKQLMWTGSRTDDHTSQLFIADFKLPE